jgi:glucosamine--fructose-6-phosphate aminotransferase (isomerizing)
MLSWDVAAAEKDGYAHFMLKEIHEQAKALTDTLRPRLCDKRAAAGNPTDITVRRE